MTKFEQHKINLANVHKREAEIKEQLATGMAFLSLGVFWLLLMAFYAD